MKKKVGLAIVVLLGLLLISSLFLKTTVGPAPDTRIVLEHTYRTHIAPGCFETADPTNFLSESTLADAEERGYEAHSECTEEILKPVENSLFIGTLKKIGILDRKWDNW